MPTKKPGERESPEDRESGRGGLASALLAVAGIVFVWAAVEVAFKPWLRAGRDAINKSLNPDYDVDDELDRNATYPPPKPTASDDDEQSAAEKKVVGKDPSA